MNKVTFSNHLSPVEKLAASAWPRRRFLCAGVASAAGLVLGTVALRAQGLSDAGAALAFDGDELVVAEGGEMRRLAETGNWVPLVTPAPVPVLALATHASRPGLIVAGLASGSAAVTVDGGQNWEDRSLGLPGGRIASIIVAATKPETFYAAVLGDGLWQSEDEGRIWSLAMDRPWPSEQEQDVLALASVELATGMGGIWIYAGTNVGLTRVPDCFCRWQDVQSGDAMDALASGNAPTNTAPLPQGEAVQALVSAPSEPETLYAALPSGIWRSEDAGVVWSRVIEGRSSAIAAHPTNAAHVVAEIDGVLQQTVDGGAGWSALQRPQGALQ